MAPPPSKENNPLYGKIIEHPEISSNPMFVKYYKEINPLCDRSGCPQNCTWSEFCSLMESPLPISFWINDCDPLAQKFIKELKQVGQNFIEPIPWYPVEGCGWRVTATKEQFRKAEAVQPLRHLMIRLTALGIISRQEEVSMIPPLLLKIHKDDRCLDMCAAPGSKTAQMLVSFGRSLLLSSSSSSSASSNNNGNNNEFIPYRYDSSTKGFIVANELDEKRSNMLVHQCKRIQHLFPFAMFTNHDARQMPRLEKKSHQQENNNENNDDDDDEYFDKILCDVMCSGDGILRKAPRTVLKGWKPFEAAQCLHASQTHVALRGANLLKVGGRLVYSTCSMNPVENEAVVCQIINQTRGAMKLVDVRAEGLLPNLKSDPGMKSWKVMLNDGVVLDKYSDESKKATSGALTESMFPPSNVDQIPLEHCIRLLPHHCSGGGFFVSVFEKVDHLPHHRKNQQQQALEQQEDAAAGVTTMSKEERKIKEALTALPYLPFMHVAENIQNEMLREYSMTLDQFPLVQNLVYRMATEKQLEQRRERQEKEKEKEKDSNNNNNNNDEKDDGKLKDLEEKPIEMSINGAVNVVSSSVLNVILKNRNPNVRICAAGLRCFVPALGLGKWKIANEAARIVAGGLMKADSPRLITLPSAAKDILFKNILYPMVFSSSPLKDIALEELSSSEEEQNNAEQKKIVERLQQLPVGCVLFKIELVEDDSSTLLFIPILRARSRLQLLTDLEDTEGLKCRLGFSPSQNPTNKDKQLTKKKNSDTAVGTDASDEKKDDKNDDDE